MMFAKQWIAIDIRSLSLAYLLQIKKAEAACFSFGNEQYRRYRGHFDSVVPNSYHGILREKISTYLPPEHLVNS